MDTLYNNSKTENQPKNKHLKNTGDIFISRSAGTIQAKIDLRRLAKIHCGQPLFSSSTADTHINPFNPDSPDLHVFSSHYRDPVTGDRGGAIKFIQRIRRCSYERAIAYLEGWHDCQAVGQAASIESPKPVEQPPVQLSLFALLKESVCP